VRQSLERLPSLRYNTEEHSVSPYGGVAERLKAPVLKSAGRLFAIVPASLAKPCGTGRRVVELVARYSPQFLPFYRPNPITSPNAPRGSDSV